MSRGCTEPGLLTFELQRDQVQLEFPALRLEGSRESGERERGCNLLPESRTALQIPLLQHAGRMQVREGTDSAAENPNLGTARCARFGSRPRGRMVAAVSGGGFVTNDLAQSC